MLKMENEYCMYCKGLLIGEKRFHSTCHNEILIQNAPKIFNPLLEYCKENNYPFKIIKTKTGYKLNVKMVI